jgi:hypothetical protein
MDGEKDGTSIALIAWDAPLGPRIGATGAQFEAINFLVALSMTWPCLVAAGRGQNGGADLVGERQPDPEQAARVSAEHVHRILPHPRAKIPERLER